jgi:hypothetical protein
VPLEAAAMLDDLAKLVNSDDVSAIRDRYERDGDLRVPTDISTIVDGQPVPVHLDLT